MRRLGRDERGAGAVEFALLTPVLILIAAGLVDTSRLIIQTMQVHAAAQAGADFALRNTWDQAAVEGAAAAAVTSAHTARAALSSGCISGQKIVVATAPTCANGVPAGRFVTVSTQAQYAPLFPWPRIGARAVTSQAQVRIP